MIKRFFGILIFILSFLFISKVSATSIDKIVLPYFDKTKPYLILYNKSENNYYIYTDIRTQNNDVDYPYINVFYIESTNILRFYFSKGEYDVGDKIIGYSFKGYKVNGYGSEEFGITNSIKITDDIDVIANTFPIKKSSSDEILYNMQQFSNSSIINDFPSLPVNLSDYDDYFIFNYYDTIYLNLYKDFKGKVGLYLNDDGSFAISNLNSSMTSFYPGNQTGSFTSYEYRNGSWIHGLSYDSIGLTDYSLSNTSILYSSLDIYSNGDSIYRGSYFPAKSVIFKSNFSDFYKDIGILTHTKKPIYYELDDNSYLEGYHLYFRFKYSYPGTYKYEYSIDNGKTFIEFNPMIPNIDKDNVGVTSINQLHLKVFDNNTVIVRVVNKITNNVDIQQKVTINDIDREALLRVKNAINISRNYYKIEEISGIKVVKSEKLIVSVKNIDTENYIYRYSKDNGENWTIVKSLTEFLPYGLEVIITENNTFKFEIRDKKTNELINFAGVDINGIGMTLEEYEDSVLHYTGEDENVIVRFYKQFINEKLPIVNQIKKIIVSFDFENLDTNPPAFDIDLSLFGSKITSSVDFSFYAKYRDYVFSFLKVILAVSTIFKAFKLISEEGGK